MTHHETNPTTITSVLEHLIDHGFEGMADAIQVLMNEAMKIERGQFLGAHPYERSSQRQGYANGFKPKTVKTRVGAIPLQVPQVRGLPEGVEGFYPSSLEKGSRSERSIKVAVAEMYVHGVSTRRVTGIMEQLCGFEVTSQQVSRAAAELDSGLEKWRSRMLGEYPRLILDARYEKVRIDDQVRSVALLTVFGVDANGTRSVLGVSTSLSEAEVHWRDLLSSLLLRGLKGVRYIVSDAHEGLKAATRAVFPGAIWQRCQFHLQQNAATYVPRLEMRKEVASAIRAVFNAPDRHSAEAILKEKVAEYSKNAPKLATWMEENLPEGLAVFALPEGQRKRLRTSNMAERVNKELKRRTRVVSLFPNEASLLRLASAMLVEIDESWATTKSYLNMDEV